MPTIWLKPLSKLLLHGLAHSSDNLAIQEEVCGLIRDLVKRGVDVNQEARFFQGLRTESGPNSSGFQQLVPIMLRTLTHEIAYNFIRQHSCSSEECRTRAHGKGSLTSLAWVSERHQQLPFFSAPAGGAA